MPYTIVIETYDEFRKRNGIDGLEIDGMILFPTGASVNAMNADHRREPPTDRYEQLKLIRKYKLEWLRLTKIGFNRCRLDCMAYPQQPLVNEMKRLADDAEKTRNELAEIEEELHKIEAKRPEAIRKRAVAEMQREVADELNEIRMKAKAITIE